MEELAINTRSDLVDDSRLKVHKDGPRHMLTRTSLAEEGIEGITRHSYRSITVEDKRCISHTNYSLSSQQEFPTWIPAWPMWMLMISLIFPLPLLDQKPWKTWIGEMGDEGGRVGFLTAPVWAQGTANSGQRTADSGQIYLKGRGGDEEECGGRPVGGPPQLGRGLADSLSKDHNAPHEVR
ncbi:hypothetical protein BHE74_00004994 [Ensete ventricosum]|nr:hypothetical protein BHE74_00004994 [Ensete ventricosum]RZS14751.1 hypothetical protein BHM03_00046484 [Ensete ventricosum]